jgi:hypothetical protein
MRAARLTHPQVSSSGVSRGPKEQRTRRIRNPELRRKRRKQILPIWVVALNQVDFPIAEVLFQRFLARDGFVDVAMLLKPNKLRNFVFSRKRATFAVAMLGNPD